MFSRQLIGVILSLFVFTMQASASTYDATLDFSSTDNPNGVWSYGWVANIGDVFNLDMENGTWTFQGASYPGLDYWARNNINYPIILNNSTSEPIAVTRSGDPDLVFQPGQLVQHPGSDNSYSLLRWTAPNTGKFLVDSVFMGIDTIGVSSDVHVVLNGTSIYDGYVNSYGDSSKQHFSDTLTLAAGDTIDFAVGAGGNGYIADSTATAVSINLVPIPAAIYLLGSGLVMMLCMSKRLRDSHLRAEPGA